MAIIVLRAWYLDSVLSASQVQQRAPDLRLSRTGLLKTAMRADFLDDVEQVKASVWWQRYLEGELVELHRGQRRLQHLQPRFNQPRDLLQ